MKRHQGAASLVALALVTSASRVAADPLAAVAGRDWVLRAWGEGEPARPRALRTGLAARRSRAGTLA